MFKKLFTPFLILVLLLFSIQSFASMVNYQLRYSKDNKIQGPNLANQTLFIQLHFGGNNVGKQTLRSSKHAEIALDNRYGRQLAVHVLSISSTPKNVRCRGVNEIGATTIFISCHLMTEKPLF